MPNKVCKVCGSENLFQKRRYCEPCYRERAREQARKRHREKGRYKYNNECKNCKKTFTASRKYQNMCSSCKIIILGGKTAKNNYENGGGNGYCWKHRRIAEEIVGRKLKTNEVVHHIDEDPKNNQTENLIIITRNSHSKLHAFLNKQKLAFHDKIENKRDFVLKQTEIWIELFKPKIITLG
jgi:hypothetical protein